MCGIFGYIGNKTDAANIILGGLKRLEYRGYDSWGVAVLSNKGISMTKKVGAIGDIDNLDSLPKSKIGIGHTRWATHGGVIENNAHPHFSEDMQFALAQNGIVENYLKIKGNLLIKGFKFITETDTEVIVRLIEEKLRSTDDLSRAVRLAFGEIKGRNTVIILAKDGQIIAARGGSPLVIGTNRDGEVYFSSDTLSFAGVVEKMLVVDNNQMVICNDGRLNLVDIKSGKNLKYVFEKISFETEKVGKEGFEHYMIKEIFESPQVIRRIINQDQRELIRLANAVAGARGIYTVGSGTTGLAAAQIAFYLRSIAKMQAIALVGADAYEYFDHFGSGDFIIAPSQSGETADVLEVLEMAKKRGVKIASNVNMPGSMMTKLSDFKFKTKAGPEICVMSTKVFLAHLAWGYLLAKTIAGKRREGQANLHKLSEAISAYLANSKDLDTIKKLAKILAKKHDIFLLGKAQNFQIVREGMVKLIEATYKHAHAMPAGDLKHYAITLMEKGVPVIVVVSNDQVRADVLNSVSQVRARGAEVIGISPENHKDFGYFIKVDDLGEVSALMNLIPLQLLAYYTAVELGNNIDHPRNIAKSVTVK